MSKLLVVHPKHNTKNEPSIRANRLQMNSVVFVKRRIQFVTSFVIYCAIGYVAPAGDWQCQNGGRVTSDGACICLDDSSGACCQCMCCLLCTVHVLVIYCASKHTSALHTYQPGERKRCLAPITCIHFASLIFC